MKDSDFPGCLETYSCDGEVEPPGFDKGWVESSGYGSSGSRDYFSAGEDRQGFIVAQS
ncbi:MAG: hypothetical protein H7039_05830 [Bryobacteraceae bacterium]|nr:hypothetical protein [Bryobacteraceae bacterium]